MIQDGIRFFRYNLTHYSLALWGFRLRFDPPYPFVKNFFPRLIGEPVFEYRTYGAMPVFAGLMAWILPFSVTVILVLLWLGVSFHRSKYLKTNLAFWRQVLRENGSAYHRAHSQCIVELIREMEHRMKAGKNWQGLATEAARLQDEVIHRHGVRLEF